MAYTYNGDIVSSVLECGQAMYDKFLDENGNFHSGGGDFDGNTSTWNNVYIGIGKNNYYYYRFYGATKNVSGAVDDYSLLYGAFRTPFNINDDMIRPFFIRPKNNFVIYQLYVGVKENKGDWNFNSNRYGDINNSIDTSLLNDTGYVSRLLYYNLIRGNDSNNTIQCLADGVEKNKNFNVYFNDYYSRYMLSIVQVNSSPSIRSYAYGYHTDDEDYYAYTQDTNIPCFNEEDIQGIQNWIDKGDRSSEIVPPSSTKTNFKLWIKGLNAPTYKLNWHNEELENNGFDFSNSTIYIRAGKQYSDGIYHHPFKEVDYSDGSIKFTWYDIDEVAETNLLFPWINLEVYASYIDDSGEETKSKFCSVDLRKKAPNFDSMYQNVVNGSDGSSITVVNYDDDPDGYDDDDDDYHDPSDNEDDTPDDSTDITVSGEVCKTFKIDQIELKKLSQFLWTSDFFDNILLVNNSPIENIISLKALIGTVTTTGSSQALALGNVTTTANVTPCNESITINVGGITLPRKYNNFLDFEPYTKVQIYLPFYGCAMLDSSLVIGRTISIKYIIDVITATAKIKIIHDNKTLYEFKTTCGSDLPITSSNRASVEMGYLSSGVGMGISIASGNVLGGLASGLSMAQSQYHSSTSGNVSGVLNFHDSRMITILVDRPVYTELKNFNKTHGRVCNLSKTLRDLKGFTKCAENVQIPFNCLDEERTMIIEQLTNGVII